MTNNMNVDFNKIKLEKCIGGGSYGDVYRAKYKVQSTDNDEETIAVKKLRLQNTSNKELDKEFKDLSRCQHENIVKMYGVSEDKDRMIYLLLEYADCGSLYDFLHSEENQKTQISYLAKHSWMYQCAKGTAYLHEQKIVHRDLKTQNLLLFNKNRTLKLCDFGSVRDIGSEMTGDVGTAHYMAPEVALGKPYGIMCDVYSFGIIFWEVMTRKKPFRPSLEVIKKYKNYKQIVQIIELCWETEPTKRPTMKGLSFTLGLDPESFGDNLALITKIKPLPEIDDTCFKTI